MKHCRYIWFLALLTFVFNYCKAQFDPSAVARVSNGKIIYLIDLKWTQAQKKEINQLFNIDSTVWQQIKLGKTEITIDSSIWNVRKINANLIELSKDIVNKPAVHLNKYDVFLDEQSWRLPPGYVDQEKVIYGFNSFTRGNVYHYEKGEASFFLPGNKRASHVYIAGSFNNWVPNKTAMQFVDSGWMIKLPLKPGKYLYKYILDSRWITDPNNRFNENDGQGNINSVVYCPNFQFKLNGYKEAKKVVVAGTFNNWDRNELWMHRSANGWVLPLYLKDGTYSYKFLVDNSWVTDPENKLSRPDAVGNKNSVIAKGNQYIFHLKGYEKAKKVVVTGTFNKWDQYELVMEKSSNGWQLNYSLTPGNYEYKFIVDGKWITDPDNPYTAGGGSTLNSYFAYKANHTFILKSYPNARLVIVTGSFNNWDEEGYRMVKQDGVWQFPLYLPQGKYLYKFIVDGKWILDTGNKLWEQNEFGTGNSVLWIK